MTEPFLESHPSRDWTREAGNRELARKIEAYWRERGAAVAVQCVYLGSRGGHADRQGHWGIRSNLGLHVP